jgi:hypothetical protein
MSPRKRGEGKTPIRPVRVEDDLWERFGAVTQQLGTDRSAWLRSAILWCLREPGAKMPQRVAPETQLDTVGDS